MMTNGEEHVSSTFPRTRLQQFALFFWVSPTMLHSVSHDHSVGSKCSWFRGGSDYEVDAVSVSMVSVLLYRYVFVVSMFSDLLDLLEKLLSSYHSLSLDVLLGSFLAFLLKPSLVSISF